MVSGHTFTYILQHIISNNYLKHLKDDRGFKNSIFISAGRQSSRITVSHQPMKLLPAHKAKIDHFIKDRPHMLRSINLS